MLECLNAKRTQEHNVTEMDSRVPFLRAAPALQLVLDKYKIPPAAHPGFKVYLPAISARIKTNAMVGAGIAEETVRI